MTHFPRPPPLPPGHHAGAAAAPTMSQQQQGVVSVPPPPAAAAGGDNQQANNNTISHDNQQQQKYVEARYNQQQPSSFPPPPPPPPPAVQPPLPPPPPPAAAHQRPIVHNSNAASMPPPPINDPQYPKTPPTQPIAVVSTVSSLSPSPLTNPLVPRTVPTHAAATIPMHAAPAAPLMQPPPTPPIPATVTQQPRQQQHPPPQPPPPPPRPSPPPSHVTPHQGYPQQQQQQQQQHVAPVANGYAPPLSQPPTHQRMYPAAPPVPGSAPVMGGYHDPPRSSPPPSASFTTAPLSPTRGAGQQQTHHHHPHHHDAVGGAAPNPYELSPVHGVSPKLSPYRELGVTQQQQQHPPGMNSVPPPPIFGDSQPQQQQQSRYPEQKFQYGQQTQYQQQPSKIDPAQIPRPPLFTRPQQEGGNNLPVYYPRAALQGQTVQVPPPADSRFLVQDDGNASPNLMRSSVYAFPLNRNVWNHTGDIPLAVLCTPLAAHGEDFRPRPRVLPDGRVEDWQDPEPVPLVRVAGTEPPPRCNHCQGYLNPFFDGADHGKCNLCGNRNGQRLVSLMSGPPIQSGTYDYDVSSCAPYNVRERPVEPIHIYAIDLTCPHIVDYLPILEQLGDDMAQHYWRQPAVDGSDTRGPPPRIGVAFFSSTGIAVAVPTENRYAVASDVTVEPFSPLPLIEWTYDVSTPDGLEMWKVFVRQRLKDDIEVLRKEAKGKNAYGLDGLELSCGGAALAFLADALSLTGGRGTLISWRRPNFGVGSITYREERQSSTMQVKEDSPAYTPLQLQTQFKSKGDSDAAAFYKKLASNCARDRVALDVLYHTNSIIPHPYLDLATLGELCRVSCGRLMWVSAPNWQVAFYEELTRSIQQFSGWDTVFKVRCSPGVRVKRFVSHCGRSIQGALESSPELDMSCVTPSTCIVVELEHRVGGIPKEAPFVFIQSALLYSTNRGKRRVRVSTLALHTSSIVSDIYRSIDQAALCSVLMRDAVAAMRRLPAEGERASLRSETRDAVYERCIQILASYRKNTMASSSTAGQLVLPERLQLLPLFCMSLLKSPTLRPSLPRRIEETQAITLNPTADERALFNVHVAQVGANTAMLLVHPNIFSVLNVDEGVGDWLQFDGQESHGFVRLPQPLLASVESLEDDGMYLLDNGLEVFLFVGKSVSEEIRQQARVPGTCPNPTVERLLWQFRAFCSLSRGSESELRPTYPVLNTVLQQSHHQAPLDTMVLNMMVDDAVAGEKDYVEFLCTLHRRIREHMQGAS